MQFCDQNWQTNATFYWQEEGKKSVKKWRPQGKKPRLNYVNIEHKKPHDSWNNFQTDVLHMRGFYYTKKCADHKDIIVDGTILKSL